MVFGTARTTSPHPPPPKTFDAPVPEERRFSGCRVLSPPPPLSPRLKLLRGCGSPGLMWALAGGCEGGSYLSYPPLSFDLFPLSFQPILLPELYFHRILFHVAFERVSHKVARSLFGLSCQTLSFPVQRSPSFPPPNYFLSQIFKLPHGHL